MKIIDRDAETTKISEKINNSKQTEVLILCGNAGFGKSMTAQKLYYYDKIQRSVLVLKEPFAKSPKEGDYIWNFFEMLYNTYSQKTFWFKRNAHKKTYGYFLNKFYKKQTSAFKGVISELPEAIDSGLSVIKLIAPIIKRLFAPLLQLFSAYKKPTFIKDNIGQYCAYIVYILKQLEIVIILDNIQNIDDLSQKYLFQCISQLENTNVFFILEYTLFNKSKLDISDISFALDRYNIRHTFEMIHELNVSDAYATVQELKPENIDELEYKKAIYDHYINISKGDLKDLFAYALSFRTSMDYCTGIEQQLKSLGNESAIYTFVLLALSNCKMHKNLLFDIFEKSKFKFFINPQEGIKELKYKKLIEISDDYCYISYSSIAVKWKELEKDIYFSKYILNILNELKVYYEKITHTKDYKYISESECLLNLIQVYVRIAPFKLYYIIDKIEKLAGTLVTPEQALSYYEIVLKQIYPKRKDFISIFYQAFRFCYGLELYDAAHKLLISIKTDSTNIDEYNISYALILYFMGKYTDSLEFIKLKKPKENTRIKLYFLLLELLCFRMLNQLQSCLAVAKNIESNKKIFKKYKEYAFFLCLADLYKSRQAAIKDISMGIDLFKSYELHNEANRFMLSLSYIYGSLYQPQKAIKILDECENFANNQILYKAIFLNNRSAYSILQGNFDNRISDDLNIAEDYARDLFTKLVILNNHLIWCIERNKNEMGNYLCQEILNLMENMPEKQLNSLLFYNLFLFYQQQHKDDLAKYYYHKSFELIQHSRNLRWRFSCHGPLTEEQEKFLSNPWNVCFLSRWEITYLPE